jgi:NADH:ubiquinone oxidoreductase subunit 2 (subunit N)
MFFFFEKNESNSENNDNNDNIQFLDDISRLYATLNKNYLLSLYFAFIIISLAGLPFFVGFISKWHIFAGISFKAQFIELVVLIGSSVLSAAYYIRLIRFLFFIESKDIKVKFYTAIKLNKLFYVLIAFLFIFNILIIFYHN